MYNFEEMDKRYIAFGSIFLIANRLQTVMDQNMAELTAKQWYVILVLGMFDEPPTLKQLAKACDSSHQNTKQLVLKLAEKGFVSIEQDPTDRRAMRIFTTTECERWDNENYDIATRFVDMMFESLTANEIEVLSTAQQKLYQTLEEMKEKLK